MPPRLANVHAATMLSMKPRSTKHAHPPSNCVFKWPCGGFPCKSACIPVWLVTLAGTVAAADILANSLLALAPLATMHGGTRLLLCSFVHVLLRGGCIVMAGELASFCDG